MTIEPPSFTGSAAKKRSHRDERRIKGIREKEKERNDCKGGQQQVSILPPVNNLTFRRTGHCASFLARLRARVPGGDFRLLSILALDVILYEKNVIRSILVEKRSSIHTEVRYAGSEWPWLCLVVDHAHSCKDRTVTVEDDHCSRRRREKGRWLSTFTLMRDSRSLLKRLVLVLDKAM